MALLLATPHTSTRLDNILCVNGYSAFVYAENLGAPDGLAFDSAGNLYVAEESAGRVSRISTNGAATSVLTGLRSPEGIAFGPDDTLYAVEDVAAGRLIARAADGMTSTLATNLVAPEGIAWADGRLLVTESNVEFIGNQVTQLRTYLSEIKGAPPTVTRLAQRADRSYSGLAVAADGQIYVANELSGGMFSGFTLPQVGVFREPLVGANRSPFAAEPTTPEGLRFGPGGTFPLYVAEESPGRISMIAADGTLTALCTGFGSVEDIILDQTGRIFVSEDSTGRIIVLVPGSDSTASPVPTTAATTTPIPTAIPGQSRRAFLPLATHEREVVRNKRMLHSMRRLSTM